MGHHHEADGRHQPRTRPASVVGTDILPTGSCETSHQIRGPKFW